MAAKPCFITLEGLDGAGKSTHIPWICQQLTDAGVEFISTREPGGTALGEALRELALHQSMSARTEALLMFAARSEHWFSKIAPALARGAWVLCDRFTDASYAYQGGGRELGARAIESLEQWLAPGAQPDCTFLFDISLELAQSRLAIARAARDRFELEDAAFFQRTRAAYLARAQAAPERVRILDASLPIGALRAKIFGTINTLLQQRGLKAVEHTS